ncbi:hypothetical protein N7466_009407 [Penicillium verhagenii]|uniref:uncharacterized protein n=1 Tax=Penicillium verhagenii TaxID=1562060 RepID=UPI002544D480|nr:uncharacterized protein N7466_009407 [Penicillium verhagenii]KAJ5921081.1 hypothetical protein N7466_009407 [Penicillium verhagenii]
MSSQKNIQKALEESMTRAKSRGFTLEYQERIESEDNIISLRTLASPTDNKYEYVKFTWNIWRLSRGEPVDDFSNLKEQPDPTPQQLKSFAEFYITSR